MGLITKKLKIKICPQNVNYYNDLGYDIPKHWSKSHYKYSYTFGSFIEVNLSDLPPHSREKIEYMCDNCEKIFTSTYENYSKMKKIDNKCYCQKCSLAIYNSGENHPLWNFNITDDERIYGRKYPEYIEFTKKVLTRDKYTCQCCGKKNGIVLEVHHLDGYDWCVEKRTDETNGITLCEDCHKSFHSIYKCGNNTKEQFEEWIGKTMKLLEFDGTLAPKRQVVCHETQKIYSYAVECAEDIGCRRSEVYDCCNHKNHSLYKKHYFWLDEYQSLSSSEIDEYVNYKNTTNAKQIICITTGKIFKSTTYASQCYNIKTTYNILKCCKNMPKNKHCGKLPDGTPLKWMYYEDFLKLPQEEQEEILNRNKDSSTTDGSFIA